MAHPSKRRWTRAVLAAFLSLALGVACDDDSSNPGGGGSSLEPIPDNLASFVGTWVLRSGNQTVFCSGTCRPTLEQVIEAYFTFSPEDSICVSIESIEDLVISEPFVSNGDCSGVANSSGSASANVTCNYTGLEIDGAPVDVRIQLDAFSQGQNALQLDFDVTAQGQLAPGCSNCRALVGIAAQRGRSFHCP